MEKFVFISYKSEDRALIQPYLEVLDGMRIPYWWDQQIRGEWSGEIDQKLSECAAVVSFLTERATMSGPVYAECRTAASREKLIPVKLDQGEMPYAFRSMLAFLNYIDLSSSSNQRVEAEKERLFKKIGAYLGADVPSQAIAELAPGRVADFGKWITDGNRLPHIAYLVSLCFFEGRHHDLIQFRAARLEHKLAQAGLAKLLKLNETVSLKQSKFKLLGAESVRYRSQSLHHEVEFVRFEDHLFGEELLLYIWDELDQLKAPLIEWLDELVELDPSCIGDVAATLSKIGRKNFYSAYWYFLDRWLFASQQKFRCADIMLSLMSEDPNVRRYIRDKLFDVDEQVVTPESSAAHGAIAASDAQAALTSSSTANQTSASSMPFDIAVRLVTGYTGMSMPDLSIHVFKKLEASLRDPNFKAEAFRDSLVAIGDGIEFILVESRRNTYARSMLNVFAVGINAWARESAAVKASGLPEFIFSALLDGLVIGRERGSGISLHALLYEDGGLVTGTVDAFAQVIAGALESSITYIRDRYKDVFKRWCSNLAAPKPAEMLPAFLEREIEADRDAFVALFKGVLAKASTENDRDRIRFLVQPVCVL
jgi:hypothetical protein